MPICSKLHHHPRMMIRFHTNTIFPNHNTYTSSTCAAVSYFSRETCTRLSVFFLRRPTIDGSLTDLLLRTSARLIDRRCRYTTMRKVRTAVDSAIECPHRLARPITAPMIRASFACQLLLPRCSNKIVRLCPLSIFSRPAMTRIESQESEF